MRDTLIIDAKNIKHRLDISGWRIAIFIFCKLCEFFDVYITLNYFSILKIFFKFYSDIIILIFFLLLLSFLEIYYLKIFFFNFLFSYCFIVTFFYSYYYTYIHFKNNFIIIAIIVAAIIAILATHYLIKINDGFNHYKSFFEGDFGGDNEDKYFFFKILLFSICIFLILILLILLFLPLLKKESLKEVISDNANNFKSILSWLLSSGIVSYLVPTIFKILNPGYRSIIIMNDNGVFM